MRELRYIIGEQSDGLPVRSILKSCLKCSTSVISRLKNTDGIILNGESVWANRQVKSGDELILLIDRGESSSESIVPVRLDFGIVYEGEDFLVADKPSGMPTHPSHGNYLSSLANALAWHYKERGESFVFRAVGRLDKNTSGLVLIAKNSYAAALAGELAARGKIYKEYLAVVRGNAPDSGVIEAPIERDGETVIGRRVGEGGKSAATEFKLIKSGAGMSLLSVVTHSGRTHQIRVHLSHIGLPLVGDFIYGTEDPLLERHALHMRRLSFTNPVTGEPLDFSSALPDELKSLINKNIGSTQL